jgi:hypothetical protein
MPGSDLALVPASQAGSWLCKHSDMRGTLQTHLLAVSLLYLLSQVRVPGLQVTAGPFWVLGGWKSQAGPSAVLLQDPTLGLRVQAWLLSLVPDSCLCSAV